VADHRPPERDALLLAAGEPARLAGEELLEPQHPRGL
jgi:hypothetical protein